MAYFWQSIELPVRNFSHTLHKCLISDAIPLAGIRLLLFASPAREFWRPESGRHSPPFIRTPIFHQISPLSASTNFRKYHIRDSGGLNSCVRGFSTQRAHRFAKVTRILCAPMCNFAFCARAPPTRRKVSVRRF